MPITQDFPAQNDPDERRTRFFALLAKDKIVESLTSFVGYEKRLLYLHLLSLPSTYWSGDTVEFSDGEQLVAALCSDETVDFLCARIDEVWSQATRFQYLLRLVPYTEYFSGGLVSEPLADEELTRALVEFSWHHKFFTPELVHLFLRVLADEDSRQQLGDLLAQHAKRELKRIAQAKFLNHALNGYDNHDWDSYVHLIGKLEEKGLVVQESSLSDGVLRIRFLTTPQQPLLKRKKTK